MEEFAGLRERLNHQSSRVCVSSKLLKRDTPAEPGLVVLLIGFVTHSGISVFNTLYKSQKYLV